MNTLGPASGLIRHTEQASSQLVLVKAPLWWEETSPRLQPGRLQPADVAWWENSKNLNTQEGFWWVGADLAVPMFYRTDLKSRIHFNLFWDLCCVTLALKEFSCQYPVENVVFLNLMVLCNLCAHLNLLITRGLDQRRTSRWWKNVIKVGTFKTIEDLWKFKKRLIKNVVPSTTCPECHFK